MNFVNRTFFMPLGPTYQYKESCTFLENVLWRNSNMYKFFAPKFFRLFFSFLSFFLPPLSFILFQPFLQDAGGQAKDQMCIMWIFFQTSASEDRFLLSKYLKMLK